MEYIHHYVLAHKFARVINHYKDVQIFDNIQHLCKDCRVLTGLASWVNKYKEVKVLAPFVPLSQKLGDSFLTVALWQLAYGEEGEESCEFKLKALAIEGKVFTLDFLKQGCEFSEKFHFISFAAKLVSPSARFASFIGDLAEIGETVNALIGLFESTYNAHQYRKIVSENTDGSDRAEIARDRAYRETCKIAKCVLKLTAAYCGFYTTAVMLELALSISANIVAIHIKNITNSGAEAQ